MKLSEFDYNLPSELIATHPAPERGGSRLLHLRRETGAIDHRFFRDLPSLLRAGDCLVLNDSRVIPARLFLERETGGQVEILLVAARGAGVWEVLARPARKMNPGTRLALPGGKGELECLEKQDEDARVRLVRFHLNGDLPEYLQQYGEMPLPPYILQQRKARGEEPHAAAEDLERYQTVYSQPAGSIAAPTAGLHFTPEILKEIEDRGIEIRRVTLHVGLGTFEPINVDDPRQHKMHAEIYEISEGNAAAIEATRRDAGRRVVAVGTTAVRTLEANFARHGKIQAARESTDIFIYPGFDFKVARAMVTNFHLPQSTLLMLISAFAGREKVLAAYHEAIGQKYRFFSYGDAMFLE